MDIRKTVVAAVAALPLFASFAALEVVSPQEGETVEQLWPAEKAFLDMPRESRATYHDAEHTEEWKRLKRCKASAKPVEFKWRGAAGPSTVKVSRLPDGKVFYEGTKTGDSFAITGRLEIARRWKFEVSSAGEKASVTFSTEDRAPRIITLDGVKNARDIGGRIGLDGRRIKQGLVFRTGGLNENANNVYWTYDEIMQLYKEGKLETAGVGTSRSLGPGYAAKIKSGKGLDKNFLRLIKSYPTEAGKARMSAADLAFLNDFVGVKTDIDFRNDRECFKMLVSPLGEHVNWCHYPVWAGYGGFNTPRGRSAMALAFSEFLEARNYPIVFHCIGGADRTGTFAYLLEAFLGVDEEEMVRDYEVTFMGGCGVDKRHYGWFMSLFNAVKALPGDTYPEKLKRYFVSLGFTEEEVEKVREFLLEPRAE